MHETLKRLCEKHKDVRVIRADSYAVDNCEEGTKSFIDRYFPHRRVLRVSELVPFIEDNSHVRKVLIYKLRPIAQAEQMVQAVHEA